MDVETDALALSLVGNEVSGGSRESSKVIGTSKRLATTLDTTGSEVVRTAQRVVRTMTRN